MKQSIVGALALLAALAAAPAAWAVEPLHRLAWLAGCWRTDNAEPGSGEQWSAPAGGTLLGMARSVRGGSTTGHEFMQIRMGADGRLIYVARPSGQAETVFVLQPGGATEAVFENLAHDFPQRVIYRLEAGGRLHTRIEGLHGGTPRALEARLTRTACDARPAPPEAFQGLPLGADEAQLAMRFGPALRRVACATGSRALATRAGEPCEHWSLAPYEVAGLRFGLNLYLDQRARQLVRVALVTASDADVPEPTWSDRHRQLRRLLTQRYGHPEATHVDSDSATSQATARWRRGDTLIELSSTFHANSQANGAAAAARERIEITYQPVTAGDAGKL